MRVEYMSRRKEMLVVVAADEPRDRLAFEISMAVKPDESFNIMLISMCDSAITTFESGVVQKHYHLKKVSVEGCSIVIGATLARSHSSLSCISIDIVTTSPAIV